jgi:signal transduction histidine kinase/putative methionine-R-sulfoxide reductase with GAF domain
MRLGVESPADGLLARIAELEAALAREERISSALRDVGLALGATPDLDDRLELILKKTTELLDADRATLYLLDEAKNELVSRITVGDEVRQIHVDLSAGIAGLVARTGQTLRVNDAYRDARFAERTDELPGYRTRSILAAAMKNHQGRTLGVMHVLNKQGQKEFTHNDEALLAALATEAAVSIDNSRLLLSLMQKNTQLLDTKERLERSIRHLKLLFDLESAMGRAASHEELVREVLRKSAGACDSKRGAVLLADDAGTELALYLWDANRPGDLSRETMKLVPDDVSSVPSVKGRAAAARIAGLLYEAMRANDTLVIGNESIPPAAANAPTSSAAERVSPALAVPLEGDDGSPIGAICLHDRSDLRPFSPDDIEILRLISANFCTAINLFRARARREREERLSTIGSLLSGIVHDLKTPAAIIGGYTQVMAQTDDAPTRQQHAERILKQLDIVAAMQREVLEFAKGEQRLLVRRVYLGKFFEQIAEQLKGELAGSKVELLVTLADRGTARFDQGKITRVIHNLARNAIEAMGKEGGKLGLSVSRRDRKDGGKPDLVLEVSDTGKGIPKEIEGKLFESFVTAGKKGTGLGLAIVKKIALEHGGSVGARSERGGSTFTVVLPQNEARP